jgi:multiple sugar transport system ATP-binding protein
MARIELTSITKRWGNFVAVDDLNLVIDSGAFVTLLGPSGCGKTTTLRMIAGLETPTSGRITIDGVPVFDSKEGIDISANKRRVGFLFQNYALWPNMTVYQNIAFGLSNMRGVTLVNGDFKETPDQPHRKLSRDEIDSIVQSVAGVVKIVPYLDRYPSELSGGQQQRVAIARTLAPRPKVLFMDEPLSNLDAKLRLEMRTELQRLHLNTGSTFLYVTHDQMEAMTLATKICLMDNGILQQYEAPLTIYNQPANLFVADFVGSPAINMIEAFGSLDALTILNGRKTRFEVSRKFDNQASPSLARASVKENKDVVFKPRIAKIEEADEAEGNNVTAAASLPNRGDKERASYFGVRPEFIRSHTESMNGAIPAEIFSVMPTGMETTVRVRIGAYLLTGVVFGGVLFRLGQTVWISFAEGAVLLFEGGALVAAGSVAL